MNTNAQVEEFAAEAQKNIEQGVEKMTKSIEDVTSFGQENMDAMVASSKRAAKAAEELNAEIVAFSKKAMEDSMAAAKELSSCKSVTELVEKQTSLVKTSVEGFMAQATRMNELMAAAAKDVFAPLNARFEAAAETLKTKTA